MIEIFRISSLRALPFLSTRPDSTDKKIDEIRLNNEKQIGMIANIISIVFTGYTLLYTFFSLP